MRANWRMWWQWVHSCKAHCITICDMSDFRRINSAWFMGLENLTSKACKTNKYHNCKKQAMTTQTRIDIATTDASCIYTCVRVLHVRMYFAFWDDTKVIACKIVIREQHFGYQFGRFTCVRFSFILLAFLIDFGVLRCSKWAEFWFWRGF